MYNSYYLLIDPHVSASNRQGVRQGRKRIIAKSHRTCRDKKEARLFFYMKLIEQHNKARDLFNYWRF